MKIIGLDVGEKRIGLARADSGTRIAVPMGFIEVDGNEMQKIAQVARVNNTNLFVIGLPRSNEGNETAQSVYVRKFARTLTEQIPGARVRLQDESLTSVVAEDRLKTRKKRYVKGDIDAEAASIILQDFIEGFGHGRAGGDRGADMPTDIGKDTKGNKKSRGVKSKSADKKISKRASRRAAGEAVAKKEIDKVKLNTKKATHRMPMAVKILIGAVVAAAIAGAVTGGIVMYKTNRDREMAEYYAELEAEMEPEVFRFTILPGETIYQVREKLIEVGYPTTEVDAALEAQYDFDFLQGRPAGATLEGYLFGETHEFYNTATPTEVIEKFLEGTGEVIRSNNLVQKYSERGLSLFEGITLASVVQKEANSPDQPTVAQVFLTRLKEGIPLGSDVTVSYALDTIDPGRQSHTDNQAALSVDSCYNTRLYAGLPCGPISNPGLSALLAVANPSDTSYLYFLTGDDGMMYYSYTESEHVQNAAEHCQELCTVSL